MESYHFIGIGGIGMSALAKILVERGSKVSGSDKGHNPLIKQLVDLGVTCHQGHNTDYVSPLATVVYGSDIKPSNPEYQQAQLQKNRLIHRSTMLKELTQGFMTFAITGTHGKTTTSSLLTSVLKSAGRDPSFAVGGLIGNCLNGHHGKGKDFVFEADESDGSFLNYHPDWAIITNIDQDHLDNFNFSFEKLKHAFSQFSSQVINQKQLVWCFDDPILQQLNLEGISYGFREGAAWKISNVKQNSSSTLFSLTYGDTFYRDIEIPLIGIHQAMNSAAVFALSSSLGIPENIIRKGFQSFPGVARRCEKKGETGNGILILDDYGHHPTEIKTTLEGIKASFGKDRRLVVIFQPHRYSRTLACLGQFAPSFLAADFVIITSVYGAGEIGYDKIKEDIVFEEFQKRTDLPALFFPRNVLTKNVLALIQPNDLVVTMGAGDITEVSQEILKEIKRPLESNV